MAEYNGSGTLLKRYVHGGAADDPIVWYEGADLSQPRYLHTNRQGSISGIAGATGGLIGINRYDEYGVQREGNLGRFQYAGQMWIPEIGLHHYKARFYSPKDGRFLQTDPIGYEDQINLYTYVRSDPINHFDTHGNRTEVISGKIRITPSDKNHPQVTVPLGRTGARGISDRSSSTHRYNVSTSTRARNAVAMGNAIARNPTPGRSDSPATPSGTVNNVGFLPFNRAPNLVQSFRIPSPDRSRYTDITVNYTISEEHGLAEGFVMRYGEIGRDGNITVRTYGEGNAWEQHPILERLWGREVQKVWKKVDSELFTGSRIRK